MCGIVGYVGPDDALPIVLEGLRRLEYRGYDSAGVAVVDGGLEVVKREGKLAELEQALDDYEDGLLFFYFSSSDLQSHMFWWDSDAEHPIRSGPEAQKCFDHIKRLYTKRDALMEEIRVAHLESAGAKGHPS